MEALLFGLFTVLHKTLYLISYILYVPSLVGCFVGWFFSRMKQKTLFTHHIFPPHLDVGLGLGPE